MWTYTLRRLFHLVPILLGVSLLTFCLGALAPGDYFTRLSQNPQVSPATIAALRAKKHYDKPWPGRYVYWLGNSVQGDFGYSLADNIPSSHLIFARLWNTFLLSIF